MITFFSWLLGLSVTSVLWLAAKWLTQGYPFVYYTITHLDEKTGFFEYKYRFPLSFFLSKAYTGKSVPDHDRHRFAGRSVRDGKRLNDSIREAYSVWSSNSYEIESRKSFLEQVEKDLISLQSERRAYKES